ncbi:hypothetical protein LTR78_003445 [Recurvomyces mirabilis]|uniref:Glycine zipper 2TM domain-containing protein n=1 Tax=Recurvomyces mirabilis TaxID=574656 RepID=A0AAE1C3L5_9PEZI|nr:hypothetical protein LTR78_003445 [Recurvomyces mirabilis]KAK5154521.1 hypothetical protein LTS14_006658 [Recurvomyces mirabilis]
MAEAFVELGAEGVNHVVENYWDNIHDGAKKVVTGQSPSAPTKQQQEAKPHAPASQAGSQYSRAHRQDSKRDGRQRKYRNELPSPERDYDNRGEGRQRRRRSDSLERESLTSERVTTAYENERDDPIRPIDPKLDRKLRRDSGRMSYAGGLGAGDRQDRAHSAQPSRSKYYDDDESDYDERTGKRYSGGGRGYDDRHDDDRGYDREVITEERYRGPARGLPYDNRRNDSYTSRDPYGPGAVATYRRSQGDLTEASKRSRSRGRRDKYYDDRDRSYSRSRSGSRDREHGSRGGGEEGWRGKLDETFDTSTRGLGVGIAGAVIGGLAGRQFGNKHKERDIVLGAVLGGLASNIAENKYAEWKDKKEGKFEEKEQKWEQRWDEGSRTGRNR